MKRHLHTSKYSKETYKRDLQKKTNKRDIKKGPGKRGLKKEDLLYETDL